MLFYRQFEPELDGHCSDCSRRVREERVRPAR